MADRGDIRISATASPAGALLTVTGTLDGRTYRQVRDSVIKAALDEPRAVVVDVSALSVPSDSAWAAFTSARWHVSTWPGVPIVLVCAHGAGRMAIVHSGAARYVPVHPDVRSATHAVDDGRGLRRRDQSQLAADHTGLRRARELTGQWLDQWDRQSMILTASTVATIFVENVLEHTASPPTLRVETMDGRVIVAVHDSSARLPVRREDTGGATRTVSGLTIVAALSRAWGANPVPGGKAVWAVLGPENRL
ncbi:MAG: sulfate transporter [Actinomycetota bacterium]|nr:sulfate transporter [Actinomycetota bacterium]